MGKKEKEKISVEDFIMSYSKAYQRQNIKAIFQLHDRFPETAELAFDEDYINSKSDPADCGYMYSHPVAVDSTRMTERCVMDMVAYLLGKLKAPSNYKAILKNEVSYHRVFNYHLDRYQRNYDRIALWNNFFMRLPELRYMIEKRNIKNLDELAYYASNYFDKYQPYS